MSGPLRLAIIVLVLGFLPRGELRAADSGRALEDEYLRQETEFVRKALLLAEMYETGGDLSSAREIYEKVVALRPSESAAVNRLADLYRTAGEREKIVRLYEALLERDPDNLLVLMKLAEAQSLAGMSDAAMATYEKMSAARANAPEAFVEIAQVLMEKRAYDLAAVVLKRGIEFHGASPYLYYARSDLRFRRGDFPGAVEDAAQLATLAPEGSMLARQGSVMLAQALVAGKLVDAHFAAVAEEVASLERRHARALVDRGDTLKRRGRAQEAAAAYSEVLRLYPRSEYAEAARSGLLELNPEAKR